MEWDSAAFSTATLCASMLLRPPGSPPVPGLRCVSEEISFQALPQSWPSAEQIQEMLPRYRLEGAIGRGGMGTVYRAFDRQRKIEVALKVFPSGGRSRLRPAYKLLRSLRHPAILPVGEFEQIGAFAHSVVTPMIRGVPLSVLIPRGGAGAAVLKLAFRRACEGIAYAHQRRIVHRDLKPSNIMVDQDGLTVVVDWDLACRSGEPPKAQGGVLGTPLYMAPELIEGGAATERSDVFSLGVLLYEILTGINPCGPGGGLEEVFHRIRKEKPPPPSTLCEAISPELDAIAMRCLEKDPAARYPSAAELLEDLEGL